MCRRVAARLFSLARRQGTGVQVEIADQIAEGAASFRAPPSPFASWSAKHPEVGRTFKVFTAGS